MQMRNDLFRMIADEWGGDDRHNVLKHLCAAYEAIVDDADEGEPADALKDSAAVHRFYLMVYYRRTSPDPAGETYLSDNPQEITVPEWAPACRELLCRLAKLERSRNDAVTRYCRSMLKRTERTEATR